MTQEQLAQLFHETYERLAPSFGYKTRDASAKPWNDVPEQNKSLMIAVCAVIISALGLAETKAKLNTAVEALTQIRNLAQEYSSWWSYNQARAALAAIQDDRKEGESSNATAS